MRFLFFLISSCLSWVTVSEAICVSDKVANLYKQPSLKAGVLRKVGKYTPLKWTGMKKLGFLQIIDREGVKSWIRPSQISPKMICLQVKEKKTQLREGPGREFRRAERSAQPGESFLDLGGEDGWTMVQDVNGHKAWINLDEVWKPTQFSRISFETH